MSEQPKRAYCAAAVKAKPNKRSKAKREELDQRIARLVSADAIIHAELRILTALRDGDTE